MDSHIESIKKQIDEIRKDINIIKKLIEDFGECLVDESMELSESDTETDEDEPTPKRPINASGRYNARSNFVGKS